MKELGEGEVRVAGDRKAIQVSPWQQRDKHSIMTLPLPHSLPLPRSLSLFPSPPFLFPHLPLPSPPPCPLLSPSLSLSPHLFLQNRQTSNDRPVDVSRQTDTGPHPTPAHTPPDEHIISSHVPHVCRQLADSPLSPSLPPSIPSSLPPSLPPSLRQMKHEITESNGTGCEWCCYGTCTLLVT